MTSAMALIKDSIVVLLWFFLRKAVLTSITLSPSSPSSSNPLPFSSPSPPFTGPSQLCKYLNAELLEKHHLLHPSHYTLPPSHAHLASHPTEQLQPPKGETYCLVPTFKTYKTFDHMCSKETAQLKKLYNCCIGVAYVVKGHVVLCLSELIVRCPKTNTAVFFVKNKHLCQHV